MNTSRARSAASIFLLLGAALSQGCAVLTQLAEQDRTVTVSIEGALIGPTDATGSGWDGTAVPPELADVFAEVALDYIGVGEMPVVGDVARLVGMQLAEDLAGRISAHFAPPDV